MRLREPAKATAWHEVSAGHQAQESFGAVRLPCGRWSALTIMPGGRAGNALQDIPIGIFGAEDLKAGP